MRRLLIYDLDYDILNFYDVITEDNLELYIHHYINKKLNEANAKFEVLEIIHDNNQVVYKIEYTTGSLIGTKNTTGFSYLSMKDSSVNKFLK